MSNSILTRLSSLLLAAAALTLPSQADTGLLDPGRFAVGLNYTGITYHPGGGENDEPYKRALDDGDFWVLLVGFQAMRITSCTVSSTSAPPRPSTRIA